MPTEITIALGLLIAAVITTVTWFFQYLPKYIQGKIEDERQSHQEEIESEKAEREERITELKSRVEQTDKLVEQIARGNDVNERLINNIVEIAKEQSTANKVVAANTNAITGNTEALGDLNKTVEAQHEVSLARLDHIDIILKDVVAKVEKLPSTVEAAKKEILDAIEKCRETQTNPVTVNVNPTPTVLIPDDGQTASEKAAA